MTLDDTAIEPAYVQEWKRLLGEACTLAGVRTDELGTELIARMPDGSLKVWIEHEETSIAEMNVPPSSWVYCGALSQS